MALLPLSFIVDGHTFKITDSNGDGMLSGADLSHLTPGSPEAKAAWKAIDQQAHSEDAVLQAKAAGYPDAHGWYADGPLVKGPGAGHRDMLFLQDELKWYDGKSPEVAERIAASIKNKLYSGK